MERNEILAAILRKQPKIHCLTNPVTMNDVANILLAAGGSAVMAQDEQEAAEITTFCQGTLLNTGVPDEAKIRACILAGKRANQLGHPVVLDPVGVGDLVDEEGEVRDGHVPVGEDRRVVLRGVAVAPCPAQCVPQRAGAV